MEEINSRCRLCGRKEENKKFQDIFEGESSLGLPMKINKLLPITVIKWDPLPHGICDPCIKQLNQMDKFYDDTSKIDESLRSLLPYSPKMKLESVYPMIKMKNLTRVYGNYLKMLNESEDSKYNVKIETDQKEESAISYNKVPEVVISVDKSEGSPILIDSSPKRSPLVNLASMDEFLSEPISPNRSPSKSSIVDLASMDDPSSEPIIAESPNKSSVVDLASMDEPSSDPIFAESPNKSPLGDLGSVNEPSSEPTPVDDSLKSPPPVDNSPVILESTNVAAAPNVIDIIDLIDLEEPAVPVPRRKLDCFLVQHISNKHIGYTCRQCYRTFLASSHALTHICEDNQESPEKKAPEEKKLPPLKIRLATSSNGKHICEFCKLSFTRRTALLTHQHSSHYTGQDESDCSEEVPRKKKKRNKSRDSSDSADSGKSKRKKSMDLWEKIWEETKPDDEKNLQPDNHPIHNDTLNNNINVPNDKVLEEASANEAEECCSENSFLVCDICDDIFLTRSTLQEHKKIHAPNVSTPSEGNGEKLDSIYDFSSGEEGQKGGSCLYCDKLFTNREELAQHQRNHLFSGNTLAQVDSKGKLGEDTVDVYICNICSVSFDRKSAYAAHKKIHRADRLDDSVSDDENTQS